MSDHGNGAKMLETEVPARARRRGFTPEYKRRILTDSGIYPHPHPEPNPSPHTNAGVASN